MQQLLLPADPARAALQRMPARNPVRCQNARSGSAVRHGWHSPHRSAREWPRIRPIQNYDTLRCDFLPITDLFFRPVYAFFVVALGSRRVVHVGVTRHPTDAWVAQQLREATPCGQQPRYLIRDNDRKYGAAFSRVAATTGITELRTAYRAPRQNAVCERFLG